MLFLNNPGAERTLSIDLISLLYVKIICVLDFIFLIFTKS